MTNRSLLGDLIVERKVRIGDDSVRVLSVSNTLGLVETDQIFAKTVHSEDTSNYKLVEPGDIAYNPSRISVGSIAVCGDDGPGAVSPMYVVVRCAPALNPEYLAQFLRSGAAKHQIKQFSVGAVRAQLRFKDLSQLQVPIPSRESQAAVVAALRRVSRIAGLHDKSRRMVMVSVQDAFRRSLSSRDQIERVTIGDVAKITTGNTPPRSDVDLYGREIEWIKTDNINSETAWLSPAKEGLSAAGIDHGRIAYPGSVVMTCIAGSLGRIGDAALVDRSVAFNQQINALEPADGLSGEVLWLMLSLARDAIHSRANGVMTRIINKSSLSAVEVFRPQGVLEAELAHMVQAAMRLGAKQRDRGKLVGELEQRVAQSVFGGVVV